MKFNISDYNTTKTGFSKDSKGSVPIGEGDCGANIWVESDNSIHLLFSKSDSFLESGRLAKLGYIKINYMFPIFSKENPPVLTLDMTNGVITIYNTTKTAKITIAAFMGMQLFGIMSETNEKNTMTVSVLNYRDEIRELSPCDESAYSYMHAPFKIKESADLVKTYDNCISSYHYNQWSYFPYSMKNQHLTGFSENDPIINRIFGLIISGKHFKSQEEILISEHSNQSELYIKAFCEATEHSQKLIDLKQKEHIKMVSSYSFSSLVYKNKQWWTRYFTDYYICLYGDPDAELITRGYTIQKYMQGCAGRGKLPIKFNGSIFTVHPSPYYEKVDYDYRKWGEPYWIQNTRLIYWNMLYSGDFEGIIPFFDFICSILPQSQAHAKSRFGHNGINLPETVTFYGAFADSDYGYGNENKFPPKCVSRYIGNHFNGQLEIAYMMLKFKEYSHGKYDEYFEEKLMTFINEALLFFKEHFPIKNKKMLISPVSSLETWQDCVNDTPDIAGLIAICRELRKIGKTPPIDENTIPPIPFETNCNKTVVAPCSEYIEKEPKNCETPELYTLFPFDIFPYNTDLQYREILTSTFDSAQNNFIFGWSQRLINAAMLGKIDYCIKGIKENYKQKCEDCFFDAYYGPNFDWTPDQDHGNSTSIALSRLLINIYNNKSMLQSFPNNWKIEFRLPSPTGTISFEDK